VSALEIKAAEPATVKISELTRDPELQCRAKGTNAATVAEYAEALRAGAAFPAIVCYRDSKGALLLADGWHRVEAAEQAGLLELPADIREGSRKDALLFSAASNASHGLRRTNLDKRRAVELVLAACPKWSDRRIAEACGVSHPFVAAVRREAVVTVTTDEPEECETTATELDTDKVVSRLSKSLDRVIAAWPPERRDELRTRLLEVCTAPEPHAVPPSG